MLTGLTISYCQAIATHDARSRGGNDIGIVGSGGTRLTTTADAIESVARTWNTIMSDAGGEHLVPHCRLQSAE